MIPVREAVPTSASGSCEKIDIGLGIGVLLGARQRKRERSLSPVQ